MFISHRVTDGYCAEIANLSYSATLENDLVITLSKGDLIAFIDKYCPDVNLNKFISGIKDNLETHFACDVYNQMRYKFGCFFEKHFDFPLRELDFDLNDKNSFEISQFNEVKENESFVEFFEIAKELFIYIKEKDYSLDFSINKWKFFDDKALYSCGEYEIFIKENVINEFVKRIRKDFDFEGDETFQFLSSIKERSYKYYQPVNFVIANFENDVKKLKESNQTFIDFAVFLHKYKLPNHN